MHKKLLITLSLFSLITMGELSAFSFNSITDSIGEGVNTLSSSFSSTEEPSIQKIDALNPEIKNNLLVNSLTQQLNIEPKQAAGGIGILLNYAQKHITPQERALLFKAIPNSEEFLGFVPETTLGKIEGYIGKLTNSEKTAEYAVLTEQFSELGLDAKIIPDFVSIISDYTQQASPEAATLLSSLFTSKLVKG